MLCILNYGPCFVLQTCGFVMHFNYLRKIKINLYIIFVLVSFSFFQFLQKKVQIWKKKNLFPLEKQTPVVIQNNTFEYGIKIVLNDALQKSLFLCTVEHLTSEFTSHKARSIFIRDGIDTVHHALCNLLRKVSQKKGLQKSHFP